MVSMLAAQAQLASASGSRGFLSREPHFRVAGRSHGETGPELFQTVVDALRKVCRENSVPLAGLV